MRDGPLAGHRILVTDAGSPGGTAVVRSLGRSGAFVVAADSNERSPAFRSRYAAATGLYPRPEHDRAAAVDGVFGLAAKHAAELIIPVTDRLPFALVNSADRLPAGCRLALPPADVFAKAWDKAATVEIAARLGVRVPETVVVSTVVDGVEAARDMGWPVVLKPRFQNVINDGAFDSFGVQFANDGEELRARLAELEGRVDVLVQRYQRGTGEGVELLMADGEVVMAFQHRRLRELPATGGPSTLRASVPLERESFDAAVALLRELQWTGLAMVEFRRHEHAVLMEINGRVWGSMPLAVRSGADFPAAAARMILDGWRGEGAPSTDYRIGVRVRNFERELRWVSHVARQRFPHHAEDVPSRLAAAPVALGLLWPGNAFDMQELDDPLPGFVDIWKNVRAVAGLLRRQQV